MSGLLCTWQLSCVRIEKRSQWVMYSCGFTVAAACSTLLTTSLAGWLTQSRVSAGFSPAENHFFDTWQLLKPEDFQVIHGGSEKGDTNSVLLYIFSSYWQILKVLSLSHSLGNLQQSNQQRFHHPCHVATLPCKMLNVRKIVCCTLKKYLAERWTCHKPDIWHFAMVMTDVRHSNIFHWFWISNLYSQIFDTPTVAIISWLSVIPVRRKRFASTSFFFIAAQMSTVSHSVNFSVRKMLIFLLSVS